MTVTELIDQLRNHCPTPDAEVVVNTFDGLFRIDQVRPTTMGRVWLDTNDYDGAELAGFEELL